MRLIALLVGVILGCANLATEARAQSSFDEMSRSMANAALREAQNLERSGRLVLAAGRYLDVLELSNDGEIDDIHAMAAVSLCGVRVKQERFSDARSMCERVLRMQGAPANTKDTARRILEMIKRFP